MDKLKREFLHKTDFRLSEAFKTRKRLSFVNIIFALFKLVFFCQKIKYNICLRCLPTKGLVVFKHSSSHLGGSSEPPVSPLDLPQKPTYKLERIDVENKTRPLTLLSYLMYVKGKISREVASWKYYVNSVDSSAALFHYESKTNLEPELQENVFWGIKTMCFL